MSAPDKSLLRTVPDTLMTFFALYLTTLFSLDTWAAARASPYRAPGATNTYFRPASTPPPSNSYQGGMYNGSRRNGGGGVGGGARGVGRVPTATDSRAPIGMGATASCGACLY